MVAGQNVFFTRVMVLSETEDVREGVKTVVGRGGVTGVTGTEVGVPGTGAGGVSKHPQVTMTRKEREKTIVRDLINAGLRSPYNKVMGEPGTQGNTSRIRALPGQGEGGRARRPWMNGGFAEHLPHGNNRRLSSP